MDDTSVSIHPVPLHGNQPREDTQVSEEPDADPRPKPPDNER